MPQVSAQNRARTWATIQNRGANLGHQRAAGLGYILAFFGLAAMLGVRTGFGEIGVELLHQGRDATVSELPLQVGVARFVALVLLHCSLQAILILVLRHVVSDYSGMTAVPRLSREGVSGKRIRRGIGAWSFLLELGHSSTSSPGSLHRR